MERDITGFYPRLRQMMINLLIGSFGYELVSRRKLKEWGYLKYKALGWYS